MKPAPKWETPDDPVSGVWKEQLLCYLGKLFDIPILIETGTCEGSTLAAVHDSFQHVHSIELSPRYYEIARERLKTKDNITLYHGNSGTILPCILAGIPHTKTLFWLDAHPCGGYSANEGDPLKEELGVIMEMRPDALIVIDDMKDASLAHTGLCFDGWQKEYRTGEIIMHNGSYVIPPFEE